MYFIIAILRQQKSNLALYNSKIQAEIQTLEKERTRVSRDLHDDFAPLLLAVKFNMNSFELTSKADDEALEKSNDILDTMIARVREISNNLMPDALLRKGLVIAVEESVRQITSSTSLQITFTHSDLPIITHESSIHIFRIIQELLHNTLKHANAKRLIIDLKTKDKLLLLTVEDDGRGFDYAAQAKDFTGFGLRSMLSRTDILNGSMYLDSKPGKGTHYIFEIPIA
ncbi:MAG: ATP-binding protein [Chitinophagaceae bacterium]